MGKKRDTLNQGQPPRPRRSTHAQSPQKADAARRREIYNKAKVFENRVAELFRFLGYSAIVDYQKDDLQFDVRLEMLGGPLPIYALVECKQTTKPIAQKRIRDFASKVEHARKSDVCPYLAILVSQAGFVNNAYEVARQQFVHLLTFEKLMLPLVDFGPNLEAALGAFRGTELERLYVEQGVVLQSDIQGGYNSLPSQPLTEAVLTWLEQPKKTFLALLGDFGAGKTSFCKRLAADLAGRVRKKAGSSTRIPVVIDLRASGSTTVTLENLLTNHFQCLSSQPVSPQSLLYLNREGYLVLLFDGFDEVIAYSEPSRYVDNLTQILRAAEGQAKVILTCRTHYFRDQPEEARHLGNTSEVLSTAGATLLYEELSKRPGFDIGYLREFTEEQIDKYLKKAIPPSQDWRGFRDQIWQTYNLRDLAERPFLLEMIVKTLPKLRASTPTGQITVADLYETYCASWFNHTDFRLTLTRERKVALVEHLARKVWDAPEQRVHYQDLFEECANFYCDAPLTQNEKERIDFEVRTALFVHRNSEGYYAFIHRSFLEFFVARTIRAGMISGEFGCLDCRRITREVVFFLTLWPEMPAVLRFARQVLAGPYCPRVSENALQILYYYARSQVGALVGKGAEIQYSYDLLSRIGDQFRKICPRPVRLEGAELAAADLRGAWMEEAWLTGANLDRSQLQGASFARASLQGASLAFVDAWRANFGESNLASANLQYAHCREANFQGAELSGADLSFAHFDHFPLRHTTCDGVAAIEAGLPSLIDSGHPVEPSAHRPLARHLTFLFVKTRAQLKVNRIPRPVALDAVCSDERLPMSIAQERIWFFSMLDPDAPQAHVLALHFKGTFLIDIFQSAVANVVRRHKILRTTYVDGVPLQEVTEEDRFVAPFVDLRRLPREKRGSTVFRLISEEERRQFDLVRGPLFSVILLAIEENEHVVLFAAHRIIADERSRDLLIRELGMLYGTLSQGGPSTLIEPRIEFTDFAQWQRNRMADLETDLSYWRERLRGAPPFLAFPTDHPRPVVYSSRGGRHRVRLADGCAMKLRALVSRHKATPFMGLLAVFKLLLSRYTDCHDIVIGLLVCGRNYEDFENLIGPCGNALVLRTDLSEDLKFENFLERVREGALAAYAYSEMPFEVLVEKLGPERSLSHTPLFQVTVEMKSKLDVEVFEGIAATVIEPDAVTARFDMSLSFLDVKSSFSAELIYRVELFDHSTAYRVLGHFEAALERVLGSPDINLGGVEFLAASERQQATTEWNDTACGFLRARFCLHELFANQARCTPEARAVVFGDRVLTYSQLDRLADRLARDLMDLGVGPEVRVALCLEGSLEMVVGLLGVLKAGGAYVPINPRYPRERQAFMLEDSRAPIVLTQRRFLEILPQSGIQIVCLEPPDPAVEQEAAAVIQQRVCPDNLCYVMYTSGSTGRPKGVMITHHGIVNHLLCMQETHVLTPGDRVLQYASFSFDISIMEFFWPLLSGACLVLAWPPGRYLGNIELAQLISEHCITTAYFPPSLLQSFLEEPEIELYCTSLRRVFVGGEIFSPSAQQRFFERFGARGISIHNLYGPTEAAVNVTAVRLTHVIDSALLGRPVSNIRLHLLDRQLRPVPIGVSGELFIGGVQLARGYNDRPDLTAARFFPDPFSPDVGERLYASGDLASYDGGGSLKFLGRRDHQVKIRGFRIELGEIESAILSHPDVLDAVVVVREITPDERYLVAYVVGARVSTALDQLRSFIQTQLPDYMVPAAYVFLPALPLAPNGKVDRSALPAPTVTRPGFSNSYIAPRNSVEQVMAGIWSELLGVERVGAKDGFFELGGHSLLAMRLLTRVRKAFQVEVSLADLYVSPTVEGLAQIIDKAGRDD